MTEPINVHLYRCGNCHTVQAFEIKGGRVEYPETCPCGQRFGWQKIKVVD